MHSSLRVARSPRPALRQSFLTRLVEGWLRTSPSLPWSRIRAILVRITTTYKRENCNNAFNEINSRSLLPLGKHGQPCFGPWLPHAWSRRMPIHPRHRKKSRRSDRPAGTLRQANESPSRRTMDSTSSYSRPIPLHLRCESSACLAFTSRLAHIPPSYPRLLHPRLQLAARTARSHRCSRLEHIPCRRHSSRSPWRAR